MSGQQRFPIARSRLVLLVPFACTLISTPVNAHDVHAEDEHRAAEVEVGVAPGVDTPASGTGDVRQLVQAFRASGDDAYLDRAREFIEPAFKSRLADADLLIDAALVAQARHEFDRALALTRAALALRDDDQAWLLLASIHLVRGEADAARQACGRLNQTTPFTIVGCHARVAHARGDAARVRPQLERLTAAAAESRHDADIVAWLFGIAGDLAVASDDPESAIEHFTASLDLSESAQVRSALVDVLLNENRLAEAEKALDDGSSALPLDLRRMILARRTGATASMASAIARTDREFRAWIAGEDWLHAREMARFYLDVVERPELARRLAEINIGIQKEPEDIRLAKRTRAVEPPEV